MVLIWWFIGTKAMFGKTDWNGAETDKVAETD